VRDRESLLAVLTVGVTLVAETAEVVMVEVVATNCY
jgi:hypothetical protein